MVQISAEANPICYHSNPSTCGFPPLPSESPGPRFRLPPNSPLFALPQGFRYLPLIQSKIRKFLSVIVTTLELDPSAHTFHCFRRSGASLSFNSNVSLQAIKHHGTWSSDAVWSYIISSLLQQGSVVSSFKQLLQQ